jgi:hypothetical protein
MNITLEQQRELAELVYPDKEWVAWTAQSQHPWGEIFCKQEGLQYVVFKPSLTGTAEQCQQALQVILAALNLESTAELSKRGNGSWQFINQDPEYANVKNGGAFADDILTAAALALLENDKKHS